MRRGLPLRSCRRLSPGFARALCAGLLATALAVPSRASADPSLSDRETARSLMDDGDAKRDKGDHRGALKSYEAADAIMHVPTTGLEVARAQAQLGLLLEARETLGRVVRSPPKPGEPAPFSAARKAAEALSADLAARIPSVTVLVTNAEASQPAQIAVDGEAVPLAASQAPRKVNPGRHTVVVRSGAVEKTAEVVVNERDARTVTIDLRPRASGAAAKDEAEPKASPGGASNLPKALAIGGFSLGALGIGVGAVTGLISLGKISDAKKECAGNVCPTRLQSDVDSARSLGLVSTIAFVAGGVGLGVGVVGVFMMGKAQGAEPRVEGAAAQSLAAQRRSPLPPLTLSASVGPTWLGLDGTF
jgi:hypothetical protein